MRGGRRPYAACLGAAVHQAHGSIPLGAARLACLRELGFEENAPFKKTNLWGGALALGHPLGESGARIVITLNNIMKKDLPDARYGLAALCGGFGNANATLWEKV